MKQLMACLALISVLVQAQIVYPQTMKIYAIDEDENGNRTVTLCSNRGLLYGFDEDLSDWTIGELAAVLMYDNMTPDNPLDDAVIAVRHTGFFDGGGEGNEK